MPIIKAVSGGGPRGKISVVTLHREDIPEDLSLTYEVTERAFGKTGRGKLVDPEDIGDWVQFSLVQTG